MPRSFLATSCGLLILGYSLSLVVAVFEVLRPEISEEDGDGYEGSELKVLVKEIYFKLAWA